MQFTETALRGAFLVEIDRHEDERGFFARSWCRREFGEQGLETTLVQCSVSWNRVKGTLRGMHYQTEPHAEAKLVRCTSGALYDVIVDLRPDSPTFLRHIGVELTAKNRRALYVPQGFAHGFLTLSDDTEIFYQISEFYEPSAARGVRWNDPTLNITWPGPIVVISDRDRSYPDLQGTRPSMGGASS